MKRLLASSLLGAAFASTAIATAGSASAQAYLPPDELIEAALRGQPEVRAAAAQVEMARAEARALSVGSHEFSATVTPLRRNVDGAGHYQEWEFQLERRIRLPGKARLDREIGSHGVAAAELRFDDAEHMAARQLLSRWMAWLRSGLVADEMAAQATLMGKEVATLKRRVEMGDAAQRELELLEAEQAQLRAEAISARAAADMATQALSGEFPQIPLPSRLPELPAPELLAEGAQHWRELIIQRSHEIAASREDFGRQQRVADRALAERHADPSVGIRVLNELGGAEQAVGLVLNLPFGGSHRSALAARERANADVFEAELASVTRMIELKARQTTQAVEQLHARWQARYQALAAMQRASERTRRAWELGEADLSEYLLAQRNHRQAQLDETQARVDALEAIQRVHVDSHELWHPELAEETAASPSDLPRL